MSKVKPIGQHAAERRASTTLATTYNPEDQGNQNSLVVDKELNSHEAAEPHQGQNLAEVWNLSGDEDAEEVAKYELTFEDDHFGEPLKKLADEWDYDYPRPEPNEI